MLNGLATNRGAEGNEGMGGVDQVPRYDPHQDMGSVSQSQNNFNPNAYNMLGSGVQQPNMGSLSNLPGMNPNGKFTI